MAKEHSSDDILKYIIGFSSLLVVGLLGWFIFTQSTPAPTSPPLSSEQAKSADQSKKMADQGRTHIENIANVKYNSNPPTSGNHFAAWAKKGYYPKVISDGYLIHALEHGYIVISYNCDYDPSEGTTDATASAQMDPRLTKLDVVVKDKMSPFTPDSMPESSVDVPESFQAEACNTFVEELKPFLHEAERIILVPRPNLDAKLALTAWTRIDKMNAVEQDRIKAFIQNYHNMGPEKTIE